MVPKAEMMSRTIEEAVFPSAPLAEKGTSSDE